MQTPTKQDLFKQYEISVNLYSSYLKLTLEVNVFYYAITGAILSYFLTHQDEPSVRFALYLPLFMSILFFLLFIWGSALNQESRKEMERLRMALKLKVVPEFSVLTWLLRIFSMLMFLVALSIAGILIGCINLD